MLCQATTPGEWDELWAFMASVDDVEAAAGHTAFIFELMRNDCIKGVGITQPEYCQESSMAGPSNMCLLVNLALWLRILCTL